jgi:hypothetical protein
MSRSQKAGPNRRVAAENESNRSGFASLATPEDPEGADEEETPPVAFSQTTALPPESNAEFTWKDLSYDEYKKDVLNLARFVQPAGFCVLGNPTYGMPTENLFLAYKDQSFTLKHCHLTYAEKVLTALTRWRVVPGTLYENRVV